MMTLLVSVDLILRSTPGFLRRAWLSFVLAAVLSAIEIERRGRYSEPPAIVLSLSSDPIQRLRARPFRARYRRSRERHRTE